MFLQKIKTKNNKQNTGKSHLWENCFFVTRVYVCMFVYLLEFISFPQVTLLCLTQQWQLYAIPCQLIPWCVVGSAFLYVVCLHKNRLSSHSRSAKCWSGIKCSQCSTKLWLTNVCTHFLFRSFREYTIQRKLWQCWMCYDYSYWYNLQKLIFQRAFLMLLPLYTHKSYKSIVV